MQQISIYIAVVVIGLLIAYLWMSRGFFSSLLHLISVVVAGAIAFAVWEPAAMVLLDSGVNAFVDAAWGLGLCVPFALSLLIIRLTLDATIRANVAITPAADLVGGGLCGVGSAVLSLGILIISVGFLRMPTQFGPQTVDWNSNGSVEKTGSMWIDEFTADFYSTLSRSTFRPALGKPMADVRPNLGSQGQLLRINFRGISKHVVPPDGFEVAGTYTVAKDRAQAAAANPNFQPSDLLSDAREPDKKQTVTDFAGNRINVNDKYLQGVIVKFRSPAKEKSGIVLVGNTQIWLVAETTEGPELYHPVACVSRARGSELRLGRWRYDTSADMFISSVADEEVSTYAFEFMLPTTAMPKYLYVKGTRVELDLSQPAVFPTPVERDEAIAAMTLFTAGQMAPPGDESRAVSFRMDTSNTRFDAPIRLTKNLPRNWRLKKGELGGLVERDRKIVSGNALLDPGNLRFIGEQSLVVAGFDVPQGQGMVQLIADSDNPEFGLLSRAAATIDRGAAPYLVDANGLQYPAIGYSYKDQTIARLRYTPDDPLTSIDDLDPPLSSSRDDQELTLLFRLPVGSEIREFRVGTVVIAKFPRGIEVEEQRR